MSVSSVLASAKSGARSRPAPLCDLPTKSQPCFDTHVPPYIRILHISRVVEFNEQALSYISSCSVKLVFRNPPHQIRPSERSLSFSIFRPLLPCADRSTQTHCRQILQLALQPCAHRLLRPQTRLLLLLCAAPHRHKASEYCSATATSCESRKLQRSYSETGDSLGRRLEQLSTPTKVQIESGVKVEMKGFSPPRAESTQDHGDVSTPSTLCVLRGYRTAGRGHFRP